MNIVQKIKSIFYKAESNSSLNLPFNGDPLTEEEAKSICHDIINSHINYNKYDTISGCIYYYDFSYKNTHFYVRCDKNCDRYSFNIDYKYRFVIPEAKILFNQFEILRLKQEDINNRNRNNELRRKLSL